MVRNFNSKRFYKKMLLESLINDFLINRKELNNVEQQQEKIRLYKELKSIKQEQLIIIYDCLKKIKNS